MVRVWNVSTGQQLERLKGHKDSVYRYAPPPLSVGIHADKPSVAFSPDGKSLVSGSLDRTLRVWDLSGTKRAVESQMPGSKDNVEKGMGTCQSVLNGHKVGSVSCHTIVRRDLESFRYSGERGDHKELELILQDYVLSVAISPDGQWVVSGSKDRAIQFWNMASGQAQFMLQGHKNSVISIDLARSGGHLASGSGDCQARIWKYDAL
jgi:glucose repression regulatory protein TUP1